MEERDCLLARNGIVKKSNELIQKSRFSLSLQQQKIMLYLISQIRPYDEEFKVYEFSLSEFCKVCGIHDRSGRNYQGLKDAIRAIQKEAVQIELPDGRNEAVQWIEPPEIDSGSGIIRIRLCNDMKPFLLQMQENFTSYELIWVLHSKSKYTVRLYEVIKSVHYDELKSYERTYYLEELKGLLDAENYKTYQDFKRRALIPAINEINARSDKSVSYEIIKKGRSVERVRLTISSKDSLKAAEIRSRIEHELGVPEGYATTWDELSEKKYV